MVSESCKSLLLIAVLAGTMLACGGSSDEKAETKAPEDQGSELPPGHPSTTPQVPASAGKGGLTWDKPEGWVEETPSARRSISETGERIRLCVARKSVLAKRREAPTVS